MVSDEVRCDVISDHGWNFREIFSEGPARAPLPVRSVQGTPLRFRIPSGRVLRPQKQALHAHHIKIKSIRSALIDPKPSCFV